MTGIGRTIWWLFFPLCFQGWPQPLLAGSLPTPLRLSLAESSDR